MTDITKLPIQILYYKIIRTILKQITRSININLKLIKDVIYYQIPLIHYQILMSEVCIHLAEAILKKQTLKPRAS